jgi:hypothetical protein
MPSGLPTIRPSQVPSPVPTLVPTQSPTPLPTMHPTRQPTQPPTYEPTPRPTRLPSSAPTFLPTNTVDPSHIPTRIPTPLPSEKPSLPPTPRPTHPPTPGPTPQPTTTLTPTTTALPTISLLPSQAPTISHRPTEQPTPIPTPVPTSVPTSTPTHIPTRLIGCSTKRCSELGWNVDKFGSSDVCGASDDSPLAGCSGKVSWETAQKRCQNVGARLCSVEELNNDEARATGCNYDTSLVWGRETCSTNKTQLLRLTNLGEDMFEDGDDGNWATFGSTILGTTRFVALYFDFLSTIRDVLPFKFPSLIFSSFARYCIPQSVTAGVRCCADVAPCDDPTGLPTALPTLVPSLIPTPVPSLLPTLIPTPSPTPAPSESSSDCNGRAYLSDWLGDGFCDAGHFDHQGHVVDLNCAKFSYDYGDCDGKVAK